MNSLRKIHNVVLGDDPRDQIFCVECKTWLPYRDKDGQVIAALYGEGFACKPCIDRNAAEFNREFADRQKYKAETDAWLEKKKRWAEMPPEDLHWDEG